VEHIDSGLEALSASAYFLSLATFDLEHAGIGPAVEQHLADSLPGDAFVVCCLATVEVVPVVVMGTQPP
jgi:hypothetical protein